MASNYVNTGDTVEHTAAAALTSGQVVRLGHCLGIALGPAEIGDQVTVALRGRFTVPKVSAAVFVQGEKLVWDSSAGAFDDAAATPASGDVTGGAVAALAGANTETSCEVILTPGNATLTP